MNSEQRAASGRWLPWRPVAVPGALLESPESLESPAHPHGESRYRCNPRDGRRVCMGQRQQQPRLRALAACLPIHILALIAAQAAIDDQHRMVTSSIQSDTPVSSGWDSSMRKFICPCLAARPHSLLAACCCPSFLSPHYNPPCSPALSLSFVRRFLAAAAAFRLKLLSAHLTRSCPLSPSHAPKHTNTPAPLRLCTQHNTLLPLKLHPSSPPSPRHRYYDYDYDYNYHYHHSLPPTITAATANTSSTPL
jgi:hypothetical protein